MRTITSQQYRDQDIVSRKRAANDYEVRYAELHLDGEDIRFVVDGHHSYEAAQLDAVEPDWVDVTDEYAAEIDHLGAHAFLNAHSSGEGWWDLQTGQPAW